MVDYRDLEDILDDEELFGFEVDDDKLFDTSRYARTVSQLANRSHSSRKRMGDSFEIYKALFDQVYADIEVGRRQIKSFETIENLSRITRKNPIKQGNFYVDNGVMLYVAKIYDPETGEVVTESTNRKYKVHLVYENGTENQIYLLSLISSLYDKKRHGRFVTEDMGQVSLMGQEKIRTGFVYVVRYAGSIDRLREMTNLYKIGVADDVKKRLTNTERQATYLYAPVQLVGEFEIFNVDAQKVEKTIHHALADKQLSMTVDCGNHQTVAPQEWFVVSFEEITDLISQIFRDLQKS